MEGRQFYLNYRKDHPVKGCEDSPIFCVEMMDILEEWESRGWNRVRVWYKLTCAEGEMYDEIDFEYLIQEALLYFPDIYDDAMKSFHASSSPRPRHPAMLHGLQRMGHDLTPVLASYLASREKFPAPFKGGNAPQKAFPRRQSTLLRGKKEVGGGYQGPTICGGVPDRQLPA
ncbi:MAG: hypothetical protein IPM82_30045 [Saprospiraceae bacterium]|nr:hypothetical protein [Saprospiraceae bacterium]